MKKRIKAFFIRIYKVISRPDMLLLPGQIAFFFVLATIPTITLITYGASMLNLSTDRIYTFLTNIFSQDMANLLLSTSGTTNAGLKLSLTILGCYYIASNGMTSVIVSSNAIYGIQNKNWFERHFKGIVITVIFVLIIIFLLVIPVFGDLIIELIQDANFNKDITNTIFKIYGFLQGPIMWLMLFLLIKIIYVLAPDRLVKSHNVNYGALFTTISWIITTEIYSYYVNNIAMYSAFYGGLSSLCILMIWFYFLAEEFVIGMALNFQRESEKLTNITSLDNK